MKYEKCRQLNIYIISKCKMRKFLVSYVLLLFPRICFRKEQVLKNFYVHPTLLYIEHIRGTLEFVFKISQ